MIRTIIFDMDGLLIDSEIVAYALYRDLLTGYGKQPFSVEEYTQNYCGRAARENMSAIISRYALPITLDEGTAFAHAREKYYMSRGIPVKPGAWELLAWAREHGIKTALASSSRGARAHRILQRIGLDDSFDAFAFRPEVERGKPYPDIFLKACRDTDTAPAETLVLEDSEAGIRAGYAAGAAVICVPDLKEPCAECRRMTAAVLPSLADVIPWLEQQPQ